jgi:lipoic acid synthetase
MSAPVAASGRLPPWLKLRFRATGRHGQVDAWLRAGNLHTVCESAHCPNRQECFNRGTTTVMILGDRCTRACRFCAVTRGVPLPPDPDEPRRVAELAAKLGLRHVVVTSVTRDDLPDGGAGLFAETIRQVRARCAARVEVLTPDFLGRRESLELVLNAQPDVFNHNLETVRRLQAIIRPQADYDRSLSVLAQAAAWRPALVVKSGLMAGLGETDDELREALADLYRVGCRALTLGQYLAPSAAHHPVARYVTPARFEDYAAWARTVGFTRVASAPLVRSSYQAAELLADEALDGPRRGRGRG